MLMADYGNNFVEDLKIIFLSQQTCHFLPMVMVESTPCHKANVTFTLSQMTPTKLKTDCDKTLRCAVCIKFSISESEDWGS